MGFVPRCADGLYYSLGNKHSYFDISHLNSTEDSKYLSFPLPVYYSSYLPAAISLITSNFNIIDDQKLSFSHIIDLVAWQVLLHEHWLNDSHPPSNQWINYLVPLAIAAAESYFAFIAFSQFI